MPLETCENVTRVGFEQVDSVDIGMPLRNEIQSGLGCRNEPRNRSPQVKVQKNGSRSVSHAEVLWLHRELRAWRLVIPRSKVDESNESVHIFKEERDSFHFGKEAMGGSERDQTPRKNLAATAVAM